LSTPVWASLEPEGSREEPAGSREAEAGPSRSEAGLSPNEDLVWEEPASGMTLEPLLRKGALVPDTAGRRGAVECPYAEGIAYEVEDTRVI